MILTGGLGVGGPLVTGGLGLGPGTGVAPQPQPDYFPTGGVPLRRLRRQAKQDRAELWNWRITGVGGIPSRAALGVPTVRLAPLPAQPADQAGPAAIAAQAEAQAFARRVARRRREEELLLLLH